MQNFINIYLYVLLLLKILHINLITKEDIYYIFYLIEKNNKNNNL